MIDSNSRYYDLPNHLFETATGEKIAYKGRRLLPAVNPKNLVNTITVVEGDRLDMLATQNLGDPLQYWHICDANTATLNPAELLKIGEKIHLMQLNDDALEAAR